MSFTKLIIPEFLSLVRPIVPDCHILGLEPLHNIEVVRKSMSILVYPTPSSSSWYRVSCIKYTFSVSCMQTLSFRYRVYHVYITLSSRYRVYHVYSSLSSPSWYRVYHLYSLLSSPFWYRVYHLYNSLSSSSRYRVYHVYSSLSSPFWYWVYHVFRTPSNSSEYRVYHVYSILPILYNSP